MILTSARIYEVFEYSLSKLCIFVNYIQETSPNKLGSVVRTGVDAAKVFRVVEPFALGFTGVALGHASLEVGHKLLALGRSLFV